jgi:hypothetical protein
MYASPWSPVSIVPFKALSSPSNLTVRSFFRVRECQTG